MDPQEVLRRIRLLSALVESGDARDFEIEELAEAKEALEEWLSRGGYAPDWTMP